MESLGHAPSAPRRVGGAIAIVAALLAAATCTDRPPVAPRTVAAGHAAFAVRPSFSLVLGGPEIPLSRLHAALIAAEDGRRVEQDAPFIDGMATLTLDTPISGASAVFAIEVTAFDTGGALVYGSRAEGLILRPGDNGTPELPSLQYMGADEGVDYLFIESDGPVRMNTLETQQLIVEGWISAEEKQIEPVRVGWTSRDPAIVSVDANGLLTAGPNPGTTWVVARTATDVSDSVKVDVRGDPSGIIIRANPTQVLLGQPAILSATYVDAIGNQVGAAEATYEFDTSTEIASIVGDTLLGSTVGLVRVVGKSGEFADTVAVAIVGALPQMVVLGDAQLFNDNAFGLRIGGQQTFLFNLLRFDTGGPRADQRSVMLYRGHGSLCVLGSPCGADSLRTLIGLATQNDYFVLDAPDSTGDMLSKPIDSEVRALVLFTPGTAFSSDEIGVLKEFALEGGLIVLVGETPDVYGSSIEVENTFLAAMGSRAKANATTYSCGESTPLWVIPPESIPSTALTGDVTSLAILCSSDITIGPSDTAVILDAANTHVLVALTAIDVTGATPPDA